MESRNILLVFKNEIMYKPIIYRLAKDYNVEFNVLEAKIFPKMEGRIILGLKGDKGNIDTAIAYLKKEQVIVETLADKIHRDEKRCVHCGSCTTVCSIGALSIDRNTMEVLFMPEKCVACGLCKLACPVNAMSGTDIELTVNGNSR